MTIALVIILIAATWLTLRNERLFDKYLFRVDDILIHREFYRMISAGFLHVGWLHLGFNAFSLYFFGRAVEAELPLLQYVLLFLGSVIGGNLLALFIHREHGDYSAVGASGGISGIMFAFTLLYPDVGIQFILIPIPVNAVVFSFLYILVSIYGIKSGRGNIGHEAHLGGAVTGLALAALIRPDVFLEHWTTFLILFVPTLLYLIVIRRKPEVLLIDGYSRYLGRRFAEKRKEKEKKKKALNSESAEEEIDRILDKINRSGMESLTRKEKKRLSEKAGGN